MQWEYFFKINFVKHIIFCCYHLLKTHIALIDIRLKHVFFISLFTLLFSTLMYFNYLFIFDQNRDHYLTIRLCTALCPSTFLSASIVATATCLRAIAAKLPQSHSRHKHRGDVADRFWRSVCRRQWRREGQVAARRRSCGAENGRGFKSTGWAEKGKGWQRSRISFFLFFHSVFLFSLLFSFRIH